MEDVAACKQSKRLRTDPRVLKARKITSLFFSDAFHRYFNFLLTLAGRIVLGRRNHSLFFTLLCRV
jgi:hypothetical protein